MIGKTNSLSMPLLDKCCQVLPAKDPHPSAHPKACLLAPSHLSHHCDALLFLHNFADMMYPPWRPFVQSHYAYLLYRPMPTLRQSPVLPHSRQFFSRGSGFSPCPQMFLQTLILSYNRFCRFIKSGIKVHISYD